MTRKATVLIVDDEPYIRQILTRTVKRAGFSVVEANDGTDALKMMEKSQYDYVISDIQMPRMGGLELLEEVKKRYPETCVILITGHGSDYSYRDVRKAGADAMITKPFHNVDIIRKLQVLHQHRTLTAARKVAAAKPSEAASDTSKPED